MFIVAIILERDKVPKSTIFYRINPTRPTGQVKIQVLIRQLRCYT